MGNNTKLNLSVGERSIAFELNGINMERQRQALNAILVSFFEDIDEEIGLSEPVELETKKEVAAEEEDKSHEAIGMNKEEYTNLSEAFSKITVEPREQREKKEAPSNVRCFDRSVRKNDAGTTIYQAFYICTNTNCKKKGKHYLPKHATFCACTDCGKHMKLRPALENSEFPHKDEYGNIFIAGNFLRADERKEFYKNANSDERIPVYQ